MKAALLTGINEIKIADIEKPKISRDTDVLLKIKMVGVCGSDIHYYETGRIGSQVVEYPFLVGHECSAVVEEVGSAVTNVKPGDAVVVEPAISCHRCDQCLAGRENTCRELKFLGCPGQVQGCLSEYMVMPQQCCLPYDNKISFAQGVLCEPLAIGLYAARGAKLSPDSKVAILGAGPIGLSCLVAVRAETEAKIYMTEKIPEREKIALKGSADWVGNPLRQDIVADILNDCPEGMDAVFECAGQQETIDQALEMVRPGGKLMLIGIPRDERVSFSADKMRRKEVTLINVRRQNRCTENCIELIANGKMEPDFMITHTFKIDQAKEAFDLVAGYKDGVVKALIEF